MVHFIAKNTFVSRPVPRTFRSAVCSVPNRGSSSDHTRGVGDDIVCIVLANVAIDNCPVNSRFARPVFEVKD